MKIKIYTQVYNAEDFLATSIESVLQQTSKDFEYILIDNGSTDKSRKIIEKYVQYDSRLKLVAFEKNILFSRWLYHAIDSGEKGYLTKLDPDDWWEPNYLERLLHFMEKFNLDIALTGTMCHYEDTNNSNILRKLEDPIMLSADQFAIQYPRLWTFPSTTWGSITRLDLWRKTDYGSVLDRRYAYGGDTMVMLKYLEHCNRIGIDDSAMYHYRIRKSSMSYEYNPKRFEANLAYCDHIRTFLVNHHTFDAQKKEWLKRVYLSSISESVRLALGAQNTLHKKLEVCGEIAAHPQTAEALQCSSNERTNFLEMLRQLASIALQRGTEADFDALLPVLRLVCPQCGVHTSGELLKLCQKDASLQSLLQDNLTSLALELGERIAHGRYIKQFDLPGILAGLLPENPISTIRDAKFYRTYPSLCAEVIKGNNINALDGMTESLMNCQLSYGAESYLQLYLTLAALEQQVPAFLFGKVKLAQFYLEKRDIAACKDILQELDEMGMEEQDDIAAIKLALKEMETKP